MVDDEGSLVMAGEETERGGVGLAAQRGDDAGGLGARSGDDDFAETGELRGIGESSVEEFTLLGLHIPELYAGIAAAGVVPVDVGGPEDTVVVKHYRGEDGGGVPARRAGMYSHESRLVLLSVADIRHMEDSRGVGEVEAGEAVEFRGGPEISGVERVDADAGAALLTTVERGVEMHEPEVGPFAAAICAENVGLVAAAFIIVIIAGVAGHHAIFRAVSQVSGTHGGGGVEGMRSCRLRPGP